MKSKIVFSTQGELRIINLCETKSFDESLFIPSSKKGLSIYHPVWSPDGDDILFEYTQWSNEGKLKKGLAMIKVNSKEITYPEFSLQADRAKLSYPKWSPSGQYIAICKNTDFGIGNIKATINPKATLVLFDRMFQGYRTIGQARLSSSSWSSDSKNIAFESIDGIICIYDLQTEKTTILQVGSCPIFHHTNDIYYIGHDKRLYTTGIHDKEVMLIDDGDWSWRKLIDISRNGKYLFYIQGSSILWWENTTINSFDLVTHKGKRLSKKHAIIHGASLFEEDVADP